MKKHLLFLLLYLISHSAILSAQDICEQKIDIEFQNQSSEAALVMLEKKANVHFFYKAEWLPTSGFTKAFQGTTICAILDELLAGSGLSYAAYDMHNIVVAPSARLQNVYNAAYFTRKKTLETKSTRNNFRVIGDSSNINSTGMAMLRGVVSDVLTKETIPGVVLQIDNSNINTATDDNGQFTLYIPVGVQYLTLSMIGYEAESVALKVCSDGSVDIPMIPVNFALKEVIISEAATRNVRTASTGVVALSIKEIKKVPALMGEADVVKSLLSLPGVSNIGEGSSGINVRGGNFDQNLILQDGALLFNATHVLGLFSTFNPDVVESVQLYKGHVPSQFGGRSSSVMEVKLRDGNFEKWDGSGGIGLMTARIAAEGPIVKNKSSLMIGARGAYYSPLLLLAPDNKIKNSGVYYYDGNAKFSQKIGKNHTLTLSGSHTSDAFAYDGQFGFETQNTTYSLNLRNVINRNLSINSIIGGGILKNRQFSKNDVLSNTNLSNGLDYQQAKIDALYTLGNNLFHIGAEAVAYQQNTEAVTQVLRETDAPEFGWEVQKPSSREMSLFINDEFQIGNDITVSAGLRYSMYQALGAGTTYEFAPNAPRIADNIIDSTFHAAGQVIANYNTPEPRLGINWMINGQNSIKCSYNRMAQYMHLLSASASPTPIDVWQMSIPGIGNQVSDQISLGYYTNLDQNQYEFSVEVFGKKIRNVLDYKDFAKLVGNPILVADVVNTNGRAYGLELFFKKRFGKFNGWVSYTYARTLRQTDSPFLEDQINRNAWFAAGFDKPHTLNIILNYSPRKVKTLSLAFTYSTGRPITAPSSIYAIDNTIITNYSDRNNLRIPSYHRLDFSYTYNRGAVLTKRYTNSFVFSLYNVYSRENPYSVYFQRELQRAVESFQLAVLGTIVPSITYNFQF